MLKNFYFRLLPFPARWISPRQGINNLPSSCLKYHKNEKAKSKREVWLLKKMVSSAWGKDALSLAADEHKPPHPPPNRRAPGTSPCMWTVMSLLSPNHCSSSSFVVGSVRSIMSFWHKRNLPAQKRNLLPKEWKSWGSLGLLQHWKPPIRSIKLWKWMVGSHHPLGESKSLETPNILSIRANKLLLHMLDDTSVTGTASTLSFHALTSYLQALHGQNKQFWVRLTT